MRLQGQITTWKDDRGFGFITPSGGGAAVFVHASEFANRQRRPAGNDRVTYRLEFDRQRRAQARQVEFLEDESLARSAADHSNVAPCLTAAFLGFVAVAAFAGRLPVAVPLFVVIGSLVTFLAYLRDKSAARNNRWRVAERTLHLLALVGGWPGALAGQRLLRHKSSKARFQRAFRVTVAANCGTIIALCAGVDPLMLLSTVAAALR
jgi:uncharacterized membrane protein YsdA (DUF1294 family)/cold shock CspA family protein